MTLTMETICGLAAARLRAAGNAPYWASALFALRWHHSDGLGTVSIDSRLNVYVDPEVVAAWTLDELAGALLHEVNHVIRAHHRRRPPDSCTDRWNVAADLEINDDLEEAGIQLPVGVLTPQRFGLEAGKTAEQYLHILSANASTKNDCGSGAHGAHRPWDAPVQGDELTEHEVDLIRRQVAAATRMAGNVPRGLARWADELLEPEVPWRQVFASLVRRSSAPAAGALDYTWRRPPRRRLADKRIIRPGRAGRRANVVVVIDTSGSMSDRDLAAAEAEVAAILDTLQIVRVEVISCDTVSVLQRRSRHRREPLYGGGGTDLRDAFTTVARLCAAPDVIVVITDGDTEWPDHSPAPSTIVVMVRPDATAPEWAHVVHVTP